MNTDRFHPTTGAYIVERPPDRVEHNPDQGWSYEWWYLDDGRTWGRRTPID